MNLNNEGKHISNSEIYDFTWPILNSDDDSKIDPGENSDDDSKQTKRKKKKQKSKVLNDLVDELNVQIQVSTYWKERFMEEFKSYGSEFPFILLDIEKYIGSVEPDKKVNNKDITSDSLDDTDSLQNQYPELDLDNFNKMWDICRFHIQFGAPNYVFHLSTDILQEVWNSTRKDFHSIEDNNKLIIMFEHSVIATCVYQSMCELRNMKRFFLRSIDILQLLFFYREVQNEKEFAQKLVNILIVFYYYYTLNDCQIPRQSIIGLAYQIINSHEDTILSDTVYRVRTFMELYKEIKQESPMIIQNVISYDPQHKHNNINQLIDILKVLHPNEKYEEINGSLSEDDKKYLLMTIKASVEYINSDEVLVFIPNIIRKKLQIFCNGFMVELYYDMGNFEYLHEIFMNSIDIMRNVECWSLMDSVGIYITLLTAARVKNESIVTEGVNLIEKFTVTNKLMKRYIENIMNMWNGMPLSFHNDIT